MKLAAVAVAFVDESQTNSLRYSFAVQLDLFKPNRSDETIFVFHNSAT